MTMDGKSKSYKCVNCGEAASALYKSYAPTVLKLTKCENCKGVVDKYIEYDPVIVMIDLVLMSKEAQRHVLFNTDFKAYWKLLVILIMLDTYGVWRNDSLFNIAINTVCGFDTNNSLSLPLNSRVPESWKSNCWAWTHEEKLDDNDIFIWAKDFYSQFACTFCSIFAFLITIKALLRLAPPYKTTVTYVEVLKAFALGHASILFTLPMLVWGADTSAETKTIHYLLVFGYSQAVFINVFTVLYECPTITTVVIVIISSLTKYATCFWITPLLQSFIS